MLVSGREPEHVPRMWQGKATQPGLCHRPSLLLTTTGRDYLLQLWMSVLCPRMGQEGWAEGRGMSGWGGALAEGLLFALIPFGLWRQSRKNEA